MLVYLLKRAVPCALDQDEKIGLEVRSWLTLSVKVRVRVRVRVRVKVDV